MNEELQETESAASAVNPASLSTHVGEMLWPDALKVEADTLSNEYGRFAVEALEPGFGLTIGHMLRRTLLLLSVEAQSSQSKSKEWHTSSPNSQEFLKMSSRSF